MLSKTFISTLSIFTQLLHSQVAYVRDVAILQVLLALMLNEPTWHPNKHSCPLSEEGVLTSEDLEALEQCKCGGSAFALSSRGLDRNQLCGGWGGQLFIAGGEGRGGGQADRGLVFADEQRTDTPLCFSPHFPNGFVKDVLNGQEVQAGGNFKEQAAEPQGQSGTICLTHLSKKDAL